LFTRCLSCDIPFPRTGPLEGYCLGSEVAFDPQRGRLWAICGVCRRWTLVPLEERWEAVEELERLTGTGMGGADAPRLLSRTENVGLFELGRLRVLRVGHTNRDEEAWWAGLSRWPPRSSREV
jgi:hypothetical protein